MRSIFIVTYKILLPILVGFLFGNIIFYFKIIEIEPFVQFVALILVVFTASLMCSKNPDRAQSIINLNAFLISITIVVITILATVFIKYEINSRLYLLLDERLYDLQYLAWYFFVFCIGGPVIEEILFKKIFYNELRAYNPHFVILSLSILFCLLHTIGPFTITRFFFQFSSLYLFKQFNNIKLNFFIHITINILIFYMNYWHQIKYLI